MHRSTRGCHALKIASLELSTKLKRCRAYQLEKKEWEEKEEEKKEEEKKEELNEEKKEEKK